MSKRTAIPDTIRDELDQSPRWWDREYQRLVARTFRERPFDPSEHEGHTIVKLRSFTGPVRTHCTECPTVLEPIGGGAPVSEVERVARMLAIHPDVKAVEVSGATITYWHHTGTYRWFTFGPGHGEREFWSFFRSMVRRREGRRHDAGRTAGRLTTKHQVDLAE